MKIKKTKINPIQEWGKRVHWGKRIKAVCKPCWEIKYCPYGPLVEEFLLRSKPDEKSCRIFGHDCPVFYVAEPLTETKELRNISRTIPRVTQFRVLKRENQICSKCGSSVIDKDIEFDHIIPWSKGGSSDEHNVMLLCRNCNRKKGKKFEDEHLIKSLSDHFVEPVGIEIVYIIIEFIKFTHRIFNEEKRYPSALDFSRFLGKRKVTREHVVAEEMVTDINKFFSSKKPLEIKGNIFKALKYRWGFLDAEFHKMDATSKIFDIDNNELLLAELSLINRLGWHIKLTETIKNKWLRL